jgi:hypothetical protein
MTLAACQKKYCWKCTIMTGYQSSGSTPPATVTTTNVCDMSEKEIREYERTHTSSSSSGNITVKQSAVCSQSR